MRSALLSAFVAFAISLVVEVSPVFEGAEISARTLKSSNKCVPSTFSPLSPGTSIIDITANEVTDYAIAALDGNYLPATPAANISFCNITIIYTHSNWNDQITLTINLPLTGWNGRFVATGGGGLITGPTLPALEAGVYLGYATAGTDGGHAGFSPSWSLKETGLLNYPLLVDFASESLKDMVVLGKQVAESYYGQTTKYTYWAGCSTGGRQGHMMAQRYSDLFDGILANSPAINWNELQMASMWPQVVMYENQTVPPECVMEAYTNATIKACDGLDGLVDGIISAPGLCNFDTYSLVGQTVDCSGTEVKITRDYAYVIEQFLQGPHLSNGTRLWYGVNPGTDFTGLAGTSCTGTATNCTIVGASLSQEWVSYFLELNPSYNAMTVGYSAYDSFWTQTKQWYDWIIETTNADLRHLKQTNTKLMAFHGLADPAIFPNGTINFYQKVLAVDPHAADYFRFFEAPGVQHCGGGSGAQPSNMFNYLVDWVEKGIAPNQIPAETTPLANGTSRPLCLYPLVSAYIGGDPTKASSYRCQASFNK